MPSSNGSQGKSVELSSLSDRASSYVKEVSIDNINMLQELGSGNFGTVYHGQAFGLYGNNTASAVFIKCLEETSSADQKGEFRDELSAMCELRHQHVLSLLGISSKSSRQCLLYEYLQLGDLRQFLLSQASRGVNLTSRETMYIVTQIASALEYLSLMNFTHKDVAAHNVLVSQNLNVKLSTLKIAQGVHSANYYYIHNRQLPVRWLPPETITYNRFTCETDVYSYGVLLWECFSAGLLPYNGFSNQEVIEMVRSRQLLPCPIQCPPRIYSLMMECWHETPNKRPNAKEIHQKLRAWYLDNSYALSTTTGPSAASTSTAPSHHSSSGPPSNFPSMQTADININGNVPKPGYIQGTDTMNTVPYYSTIDPYKTGADTPTSCSLTSFDETSEVTDSTLPKNSNLNHYNSTPNQRYASLSRKSHDPNFGTQTTPLFHQTDQV